MGTAADLFTNPLTYLLPGWWAALPTGSTVLGTFNDRYTYDSTYQELLYGSEDAYATARLYYLENRRYTLSPEESSDDLYEIYEEAYE